MKKLQSPALCLLLVLILLLPACSTGEPPALPEEISEVPEQPTVERSLPAVMGVALDPAGEAIPFASVGDEIGDRNGVISGDLGVSPSGWLAVEAFGYATGYAHTFGSSSDSKLFEARLTPFTAGSFVSEGMRETLVVENDDGLGLQLTFDSTQFNDPEIGLMVTPIDRLDVEAAYAPVDAPADLNLHYAFAVQAFNDSWQETQLAPGAQLEVSLTLPMTLDDSVVLATFDAASGTWLSIPEACVPLEPGSQVCLLGQLVPLFGIFHEAEVEREQLAREELKESMSFTGGGMLLSSLLRNRSIDGSHWDGQFKIAWDAISDWLNAHEMDMWEGTEDEDILNDPALQDLIDDLIDAALEFAANNRNEAGKLHLIKAGEPALILGQDQLSDAAYSEAANIAYEMGAEILKDPDCSKFQEAFKIAENNSLLAGFAKNVNNAKMAKDIYDTYEELLKDCDVWRGTIEVQLPTLPTHPVEDFARESGMSQWYERHWVQISTNIKTYESRAEDHVDLLFQPINYAAKGFECPNEITYASTQPGKLFLTSSGYFDGHVFQNYGPLSPKPDSSPGTIMQQWNFQSKYGDPPTCQPDEGGQLTISLAYVSLLAHGFVDDPPTITFQEILNTWEVGSDVIQGSRDIEHPEPDTANIPVASGSIRWNLHHDDIKLPRPE